VQFAFTHDQLAIRDSARALLKRECTPVQVRDAWSNADGRVPGLWAKLGELGLLGVLAPEDAGGLGAKEIDLVLVVEEHGRVASPEPFADAAALAVPLLRDVASKGIRDEWLAAIAAGKATVAVGLGPSPHVVAAGAADVLLLEKHGEIHAVARKDVSLRPQTSIDGARRLARVTWIPSPATLVAHGEAAATALDDARDRGAVATAAELIGLSRHMLETTVAYVKARHQFGKPIGSFQAIKHHLADAHIAIELAAPSVYRAAYSLSHVTGDRSLHASMAKALASDAAQLVARKALQCHGAIGYAFENDLQMWMKRAWALAATWGDAASHRSRVARSVLSHGGV
jgi:alkylation response protein AidB-like acyl-CoA dehydrogenase